MLAAVNSILFISALLYIPLFIKLRKFSHLTSAKVNRPQRFVFWKLIMIILAKFIHCLTLHAMPGKLDLIHKILSFTVGDIFLFPLTSQLAYLGCNKRNLDSLLQLLEKNFIEIVVDSSFRTLPRIVFSCYPPKVAPVRVQNVYSVNSVVANKV
ncbi:unnamed protein product [Caenorhabditis brenneri]